MLFRLATIASSFEFEMDGDSKKMVHSLVMPPAFGGTWLVSAADSLVETFVLLEIGNGMVWDGMG